MVSSTSDIYCGQGDKKKEVFSINTETSTNISCQFYLLAFTRHYYLWRSLQCCILCCMHMVLVDSRFCWNPLSCQTIKIIRLWSQECWCQCNDEAVCGAPPLKTQVKVKVIIKNKFPVTGWQFYYQNCRVSGYGWLWSRHKCHQSSHGAGSPAWHRDTGVTRGTPDTDWLHGSGVNRQTPSPIIITSQWQPG